MTEPTISGAADQVQKPQEFRRIVEAIKQQEEAIQHKANIGLPYRLAYITIVVIFLGFLGYSIYCSMAAFDEEVAAVKNEVEACLFRYLDRKCESTANSQSEDCIRSLDCIRNRRVQAGSLMTMWAIISKFGQPFRDDNQKHESIADWAIGIDHHHRSH